MIARADELLKTETTTIANTASVTNSITYNPNLPTINLPQFEGSYEGWTQFFEIFNLIVST